VIKKKGIEFLLEDINCFFEDAEYCLPVEAEAAAGFAELFMCMRVSEGGTIGL
jgi:hypothetical protein